MPDKKKTTKLTKSKKEERKKETEKKENTSENPQGGLPDMDIKKFLGCGG